MIILPAIDIIDGKPVRLTQGDYDQKEIVAQDVCTTAKSFEQQGASWVHMVDLDGAKAGQCVNQELILQTANALYAHVEIGGGIRTMKDVDTYLNGGVSRVILGTSALNDESFLKEAIAKYGDRIAVGVDCKNGYVYGRGWLESSQWEYVAFAKYLESLGVKTIIVTDISKDGTLSGPNVEMLKVLKENTNLQLIASGGVHVIDDIVHLRELELYGAICGKAIYHHTLDLEEAIQASR